MSNEPIARKAMRLAERGARADASRLVASVPELMRQARLRLAEETEASPALAQLAAWALPRFAAATAVAVIAATSFVMWERGNATTAPASFEWVILDGDADGSGDAVIDDLLDLAGSDG